MSCDDYCTNFGCNSGPGCPVGGACHHMPGCQDTACPGHPGRFHGAQVARVKSTRPAWLPGKGVPPEAGNFQIVDLGPDDSDDQPLTHDEALALVRTLLSWLLGVLALVGAVALAVSYSTEAHAAALWALLQGVV